VPKPATGNTAFLTFLFINFFSNYFNIKLTLFKNIFQQNCRIASFVINIQCELKLEKIS